MTEQRYRLNSCVVAGLLILLWAASAIDQTVRQVEAADDAEYAALEQTDTAAAYGEYLDAYPAGGHAATAWERQEAETYQAGRTFRDALRSGGEGPEMVVVSAGSFRMGSPSDQGYRKEQPVHRVMIGAAFAVGVYEVTLAEYGRFVDATGRDGMGGLCSWEDPGYWQSREHPVVCVNWMDAQAYIAWLTQESGAEYRLLSDAEWEYVARAGSETAYSWGNEIGENRANCDGCGSLWDDERTAPVGSFEANAFGLYDVHGNVWEWVEDCWHGNYERAPTDGTAWGGGGEDCDWRVVRGGSWNYKPGCLRSWTRSRSTPGYRNKAIGFRVARRLPPLESLPPYVPGGSKEGLPPWPNFGANSAFFSDSGRSNFSSNLSQIHLGPRFSQSVS